MKKCTLCLKELELSEFGPHKKGKDGKHSRCKFCQRTLARELRQKNLEKHCENVKKYQKLNPDKTKNTKLKTSFSITLDEYNEMLIEQNESCAICKNKETHMRNGKIRTLVVDHCHKTGKIRQLLCNNCNIGLGQFKDNVNLLNNAISYLNNHKDSE